MQLLPLHPSSHPITKLWCCSCRCGSRCNISSSGDPEEEEAGATVPGEHAQRQQWWHFHPRCHEEQGLWGLFPRRMSLPKCSCLGSRLGCNMRCFVPPPIRGLPPVLSARPTAMSSHYPIWGPWPPRRHLIPLWKLHTLCLLAPTCWAPPTGDQWS